MDDLIGKTLDKFTIEERIGKGGMATVYRAHQPAMHRDVALKVIQLGQETDVDDDFRRRFAREASLIAKLEHIHILPVYDYDIQGEVAYLAMRLLRGGTLGDLLRHEHRLPLERTVEIFGQITRGLAYAHSKGVIHRDLKPGNVMLDDEGNACLTDFGLAKLVDREDESLTYPGNIVGTPTYMAPEQLRGEPVDHRSDIYSLGVILFQMLTGKPPFVSEENEIISVIYQHLERVPPLPSDINPDLPPEVDSVILKALEKKPEDRYDHVGEMTNALRIAAGLDPTSTRDFPAVGSGQPMLPIQTSRQPRTVMAGVAILSVLIVTAIIVGLLALRDDGELPQHEVISGEFGGLEATLPTDDEITTALRRLGDDGFVGLVTCNRTSEYHAGTAREIVEFLDSYGIETRIYDSQNIEARQIPLIEQARSDGAAGLIICPLNIELLDEQLTSIEEAKMPLVLFSTGDNHYGGVYIEGDNYLLGLKPGQFAGEIIRDEMDGQADVVVLDFPDLPNIVRRADGLVDGVLEVAPEANIVARVRGGTQTFGHDSIETLLADGVEFDVIVSINDDGSIGAIAAMDEAGIPPEAVVVVSIDAEALAKQYIEQRYYMRGSVAIDRTTSSQAMAGAMVRMLGGGTLPAQISLPPGDVVTREILQSDDA